MVGQNEMGLSGQKKTSTGANPALMQAVNFGNQSGGIHHGPPGDQARDSGSQDSRRDQMEDVFFPSDFHRVSRIIASLRAEDPVSFPGHDIEDFSFPLIPPLETQDNRNVCSQKSLQRKKEPISYPAAGRQRRRRCSWALG